MSRSNFARDAQVREFRALALPVVTLGPVQDPRDTDWRDKALCTQVDPDMFFPEPYQAGAQAKAVCKGCEVRTPCLEFALEHGEPEGIWGGLNPQERRKLRVRQIADGIRVPLCKARLHRMTVENTYRYPNGVKTCRACKAARATGRQVAA